MLARGACGVAGHALPGRVRVPTTKPVADGVALSLYGWAIAWPIAAHTSDRCAMAPVLSPIDSAGTPRWCSIVSSRLAIGVSSG